MTCILLVFYKQILLYLQYKQHYTHHRLFMSQATISIRVDQSLKKKFDSLCEIFGISTTAAFNIFMKAVVREQRIPFEIKAKNEDIIRQKGLEAFEAMRQSIAESEMPEMTLEEINNEIMAVRNERKEKDIRRY